MSKNVAKKAAEFASMGYKTKTAMAAAKIAKESIKDMHAQRFKDISEKLGGNEIQQIIEQYIPGAKEYHRDLHTYEKVLYDKAMDAALEGAPNANELMEIAEHFSTLI